MHGRRPFRPCGLRRAARKGSRTSGSCPGFMADRPRRFPARSRRRPTPRRRRSATASPGQRAICFAARAYPRSGPRGQADDASGSVSVPGWCARAHREGDDGDRGRKADRAAAPRHRVVDARGVARIVEDHAGLRAQIEELTALRVAGHPEPNAVGNAPEPFASSMNGTAPASGSFPPEASRPSGMRGSAPCRTSSSSLHLRSPTVNISIAPASPGGSARRSCSRWGRPPAAAAPAR
jgi:hypothetical protein